MYNRLYTVLAINSVVMFLLTYALIDSWAHFIPNINRVYMALMMVAPMAILMLVVMGAMYENKRLNYLLIGGFALLFVASFSLARVQGFVGDDAFLRSMIPHHSSAIVMCEESDITDQEIEQLCDEIVKTRKEEIAQMEDILDRR
jgi:uncharacterized protein (DUF305 family)